MCMCNYWQFQWNWELSPIVIAMWLMEYWENQQKWIIAFYLFNEQFGSKYFMLFKVIPHLIIVNQFSFPVQFNKGFFSVIPKLYQIELWKLANMLILLIQSVISNLKCVALIDCEQWAIQSWKSAQNSNFCPSDLTMGG